MIIELSPDLSGIEASQWARYAPAIENLVSCHAQGWHILFIPRGVADAIINNCDLSQRFRNIVRGIGERASVLGGQARASSCVIFCGRDDAAGQTYHLNQIPVGISRFFDMENCLPSRLITENAAVDGQFLLRLCELLARDLDISRAIKLDLVHGGGATTADRYQEACGGSRPTLCVIDSDRKYHDGPLGDTARRVVQIAGQGNCPSIQYKILPVREFENALPISSLYEVYKNDQQVRIRIESLCVYIQRSIVENVQQMLNPMNYIDCKVGVTRGNIAKIPDGSRSPFVRFAQIVSINDRNRVEFDDSTDSSVVHPGISTNLLANTLDFINNWENDVKMFCAKIKNSPNWVWLSELLRLVGAYGAGGERLAQ